MGQKTKFGSILQRERMSDVEYIKFLQSQIMEMSANIDLFLEEMDRAHFSKKSVSEVIMKTAYADSVRLLMDTTATEGY